MDKIMRCPRCGKVVAEIFPLHYCKKRKKGKIKDETKPGSKKNLEVDEEDEKKDGKVGNLFPGKEIQEK